MNNDELIRAISQMHPEELLQLYVEAKTGKKNFVYPLLPEHVIKAVNEIKVHIDNYNTSAMLSDLPESDGLE